jgi:hypothetical protein
MACLAVWCISTLLNIKCVFLLSLQVLSVIFLILRRIQQCIIIEHRSSHKLSVVLVRFRLNVSLSAEFWKSSNFKFHENLYNESQVVPCRRTGIMKLTVAFHNFSNAPNNGYHNFYYIFSPVYSEGHPWRR